MSDRRGTTAEEATTADHEDADEHDEKLKAEVQDDSDQLLAAVDEIRRLETEKRQVHMSSPEFHRAADLIERKARAVFGLARAQREVGEALTETQDESINDQAAEEESEE